MKPYVEIAPTVFMIDDFIENSQEYLDNLSYVNDDKWQKASIGNDSEIQESIRNTDVILITELIKISPIWQTLNSKIWHNGDRYAKDHNFWFSNMEIPQLLRYQKDEAFYSAHVDSGRGAERIFSSILYLNDVEEGGETYFTKFDLAVKPKAGRMIFFPSNYTFIHEARPPKSGEKNVVVTWFNP